jgi:hypothetical protein
LEDANYILIIKKTEFTRQRTWGFKMRRYEADIRIAVEGIQQGTAQKVTIQADRSDVARAMLEV